MTFPDVSHLWMFIGAALVLLVIPGPAVLYIVARSVEQGRTAGLVSVLGIHAASLVHMAAAVLGLSALLATSALAFGVVKMAGAAYLIWLGIRKLVFERGRTPTIGQLARKSHARLFREGFLVNLLNPKIAIFFLAFLPQFADPARGPLASQIVVLGLVYAALGLVTDGAYALAAGSAGDWLRHDRTYQRAERIVGGIVMIGLGLTAALAGNHRK